MKRTRTTPNSQRRDRGGKPSATATTAGNAVERPHRATTPRARVASPIDEKYAAMTFYDAATRTVRDVGGDVVDVVAHAASVASPEPLDVTPAALAEIDKLYGCEEADPETIQRLALLANLTVANLEHRRHDFTDAATRAFACDRAAITRGTRRGCLDCPYWDLNLEMTPF